MLNNRDFMKVLEQNRDLRERVSALERLEFATVKDPAIALALTMAYGMSFTNQIAFFPPSGIYNDGTDRYIVNYANPGTNPVSNIYMKLQGTNPRVTFYLPKPTPLLELEDNVAYAVAADHSLWEISGTESWVLAVDRGLTLMAWVVFVTTASADEFIISKRMATTNFSYALRRNSSGVIVFEVSGDGTDTNAVSVTSGAVTVGNGSRIFICGRIDPGTKMTLNLNDQVYTNTTSIPSSIYTGGTARPMLGARDDATTPPQGVIDGYLSFVTVAGSYLDDKQVAAFYNMSKNLFNYLWTP